jgi:hypothetical protein
VKTFKTFIIVLSILFGGSLLVAKVASSSEKGGELVRQMNANNYILAFGVLVLVAGGFALLNSAMDAEKQRQEEAAKPTSKKKKK